MHALTGILAYGARVASVASLYVIVTSGVNLAVGYTGLVSLASAALYGVGAYVSALLALQSGHSSLIGVFVGMVVSMLVAGALAAIFLRLGDDYFVVATIGMQLILWSIFNNWEVVTRGAFGIPGVPALAICGVDIDKPATFLFLVGGTAALVVWACSRLIASPYGRVLRGIREDPSFVAAIGKDPKFFKITVMALSGASCGLAGALYSSYLGFIDPTGFTLSESLLILSMVIIGGAGDLRGPIIGAVLLASLPEVLRFVGLPSQIAAHLRQIMYGGALVATLLFRPQGILGSYGFERRSDFTL